MQIKQLTKFKLSQTLALKHTQMSALQMRENILFHFVSNFTNQHCSQINLAEQICVLPNQRDQINKLVNPVKVLNSTPLPEMNGSEIYLS